MMGAAPKPADSLHCITLPCQCIAQKYIVLKMHCTKKKQKIHCMKIHCTALHCTALCRIVMLAPVGRFPVNRGQNSGL